MAEALRSLSRTQGKRLPSGLADFARESRFRRRCRYVALSRHFGEKLAATRGTKKRRGGRGQREQNKRKSHSSRKFQPILRARTSVSGRRAEQSLAQSIRWPLARFNISRGRVRRLIYGFAGGGKGRNSEQWQWARIVRDSSVAAPNGEMDGRRH